MTYGIDISNLSKQFGPVLALNNVNFRIDQGKIIALLGPNGAGKSTLIRLLTSIMTPSKGTASVYGYDIREDSDSVKRITGLLPEESALYEKLSILEYCEFIGALYDLPKGKIHEEFERLAKRLNIYSMKDRLIETLSKGQKQKVALIVAFLHSPILLLLDEPMANLDVVTQIEVKKMLKEYQNQKRTILIATHLLENVKDLCDTIIIIDKGSIKFTGTIDEFSNGNSIEDAYVEFFSEVDY